MNKIKLTPFYMLCLLAAFVFSGCGNDDSGQPSPTKSLSLSVNTIAAANTASTNTVAITSNTTWSVTSNQPWVTVSPDTGSNAGAITINVAANTTTAERTATVTVAGVGAASQQVSITQAAGSAGSAILCTGKPNVNSYFPLAMGNKWSYGYNYNTSAANHVREVVGTQVYDGKTYFDVKYTYPLTQQVSNKYFRTDANNDVYQYVIIDGTGSEHLYLPGAPTLNQEIGGEPGNGWEPSRKITSLNGNKTIGQCAHTDLLLVQHYYQNGNAASQPQHFKKGLGLVYNLDYTLKSATINN